MLLTIHNLPSSTQYADVKALLKERCDLKRWIVDNLVTDGGTKKVTVGVADEEDAALVMSKINGIYIGDQQVFVEDLRHKQDDNEPYRPPAPVLNQYLPVQPSISTPQYSPQFDMQSINQQLYQASAMMTMNQSQAPQGVPPPNFGVPYYMTAQNPNVGNNPQLMVQYPQVQGSTSNDPHSGNNTGLSQDYKNRSRERSRSRSPDRSRRRGRSPRRHSSKWNEPDRGRRDGSRDRDRTPPRDYDRYHTKRSTNDTSQQGSFQSRFNQSFGSNKQNSNRLQKPSNRSIPPWERTDNDNSTYKPSTSIHSNDHRQAPRHNQKQDAERFKEELYSQSRGSDYFTRRDNVSKNKRPNDMPDKFKPPAKKFGNNQQYDSRNRPENSGGQYSKNVPSSNPNNSSSNLNKTFKRPNDTSMNLNRPLPKKSNNSQQAPKTLQQQSNFIQKQAQPSKPQPQTKPTVQSTNTKNAPSIALQFRFDSWVVQAASIIAQDIAKNVNKLHLKRDPMLIELKAQVRARMKALVGNDMSLKLQHMLKNYRLKYKEQDDLAFYNEVAENFKKIQAQLPKTAPAPAEAVTVKKVAEKPKPEPVVKVPVQPKRPEVLHQLIPPSIKAVNKLLKDSISDKQAKHELKKIRQEEILNESLYNLDPVKERILQEELDKMCEIFKEQILHSEDETDQSIGNFLHQTVWPNVRKLMTLHAKKRILDIRTNLSVRVYCHPKNIKREMLENFLKNYGMINLKKSTVVKNMFVATFDSYKNYDAIMELGGATIGKYSVSFKPLQILGPPKKGKNKHKKDTNNDPNDCIDEEEEVDDNDNDDGEDDDDDDAVIYEEDGDYSTIDLTNENQGDVVEIQDITENEIDNVDSHVSENNEKCDSNKLNKIVVIDDGLHSKDIKVGDEDRDSIIINDETNAVVHEKVVGEEAPVVNEETKVFDGVKDINEVTSDREIGAVPGNKQMNDDEDIPYIEKMIVDDDLEDF